MPIRKVTMSQLSAQNENNQQGLDTQNIKNKYKNTWKAANGVYICIGFVLILFAVSVGIETYSNYLEKYQIDEQQSKACLLEFMNKQCNPLRLTDDCNKTLNCVQKQEQITNYDLISRFLNILEEEISENSFLPAILTIILLLLKVSYEIGDSKNRKVSTE